MTSIVDEVVVYTARKAVAADPSEVPLRLVPPVAETNSPRYKNIIGTEIKNERGVPAGKFGWCIMSRESANSFCKDTRVPVCTKELKYLHLEEMTLS